MEWDQVVKKEPIPRLSLRDLAPNQPLTHIVHSACEQSHDAVFDSILVIMMHYDWYHEHEPAIPVLFVYSAVDRTTRKEAIEQWLHGNKAAWQASGRVVRTLLLPNTGHCMHWFRAREKYEAALVALVEESRWYSN